MKHEKQQVSWYALDEEDNTPDLFFRYLITGLTQTDEQLIETLGPLLDNGRELVPERVIPHLIEALSGLSHNIRLVLDDFHQITNSDIHFSMARLMQYMPARLQLVILSRYGPPAPVDAIALKMDCTEITAADLKFTETETLDLFEHVTPNDLSADQIRELNRHVEGWAAGLQLIGLSVKSNGGHPDLSNLLNQAHEQVANYLIHDILQTKPQKIRKFVSVTALLDRFNPELCTAVTGIANAVQILSRLEHMNLFLIPLDNDRKWYRYHHMFSEVVRRQYANTDSGAIPVVLRKAALWLTQNNQLEDALRCAFRTNDFEFVADLMEDNISGYLDRFELAAGLRWILKLPESVLNQRVLLRLFQCAFLSLLFELTEVREIMTSLEENGEPDLSRYSGDKLTFGRDLAAYFKCMLHIFYAGENSVVEEYQTLRNKIFPQNPLLVGAIETHIVTILISNGDLPLAESFLDRLSAVSILKRDRLMKKKVFHAQARALIAKHRGQLRRAEGIIQQVLQDIDQQGYDHTPLAFLLHRHLGSIFYLQNRLDEARQCAANAVKYCEYFGLADEILAGSELWLQLHLAAGENEQAANSIQKIQAISIKLGMPKIATSAELCAAQLAIHQGSLAAAQLWSKQRSLQANESFSLLFAQECLTQARLYYAQKSYVDATQLLDTLRGRCAKRNLAQLVLQIDILQSAVYYALNQQEKAVAHLKKALALSQTEGYIRLFANDAQLIAPVLKHLKENNCVDLSSDYLEQIFTACHISVSRPIDRSDGKSHGKSQDLTRREIEILMLIAQGFQNKEIAQKAFISITTVKSHVSNILVKLNVKTRTQAILKAKGIKILK